MISKYQFNCIKCGKYFEIKGHWYNQYLIKWYADFLWVCHCIAYHRDKGFSRGDLKFFARVFIAFFPLLLMQIIGIATTPIKML